MTRATVGAQLAASRSGFFIGAGLSWNLPTEERVEAFSEDNDDAVRRLLGLAGADRLSPGRAGLCAAAAAPAAAAAAAAGAARCTT